MKNLTRKFETKEKISWNKTEHLFWDGRHWCLSNACRVSLLSWESVL